MPGEEFRCDGQRDGQRNGQQDTECDIQP